jgi:hypothetical protein
MGKFDKLEYETRKDKFGIIAKIKYDNESDPEEKRTYVSNKYKVQMMNGSWVDEHSTDIDNKKWEWGTHRDYLGKGTKLLLYDKSDPQGPGITVIASVLPREAFRDPKNTGFPVRNVMKGKPIVMNPPIPLSLVIEVGLKDPAKLGRIAFEDITKDQFDDLNERYKRSCKASEGDLGNIGR